MMNRNKFGRKCLWSNRDTIAELSCSDLGKQREKLFRIAGVPTEIRAEDFRNASLERYC
jgi:hypothetical protein